MKAKAGNGLCIIESKTGKDSKVSKVRIGRNTDKQLYCMYKGKRYILNSLNTQKPLTKLPTTKGYTSVTLIRGRKRSSYSKKRTNSRRKRRSKRRPRSLFKTRRSIVKPKSKTMTKVECKKRLSNKIAKNIREFKKGKFKSRKQAIAVSYSQIKKEFPYCKRYFKPKPSITK